MASGEPLSKLDEAELDQELYRIRSELRAEAQRHDAAVAALVDRLAKLAARANRRARP